MKVGWQPDKITNGLLAVFVAVTVVIAYYPGLHGPFVFDDQIHILSDPSIRITSLDTGSLTHALLAQDGSLSNRPLAKASFAINYYLAGGTSDAYGYKITNLAIHIVNTFLIYCFTLLLIRRQAGRPGATMPIAPERIAILVAALWALHPLHLTTVLYVVQRMASLATLFVLAGLIVYIHGRQRVHERRDYGYTLMIAGAIGGLIPGLGCKENAVVILPLMLVIEYVFFGTAPETLPDRRRLGWFYGFFVFMPAALLGLWVITHPGFILDPYLSRNFTPVERLLTESRVLWFYVGLLLLPNVRSLGLYHDDIPVSSGLFDPWTTSIALLCLAAAVVAAILARRRYPFLSFAVLWFLIGHSIESSIIGLEIAHEHRNYLPDIGILLAVGYGLSAAARKLQEPIRIALFLAPLGALAFVTNTLAHDWASDKGIIESLARNHPGSARGQYMLAELYAERKHDLAQALVHYRKAAELAPDETGYLMKSAVAAVIIELGTGDKNRDAPRQGAVDDTAVKTPASGAAAQPHQERGGAHVINSKLTDEISFRLKELPITPSTQHILDELANCVDQVSSSCRSIYPEIKSWFLAASQNRHINSMERANLIVYLFNLGTARPDLDLSMQAAQLGKKFEPSNPVYELMEANVFILRGELETADAMLKSVLRDSEAQLTPELRENIKTLFAQIESHKTRARPAPFHYQ